MADSSPKNPKKCSKTCLVPTQPEGSQDSTEEAVCHICGANVDLELLNKHVEMHLKIQKKNSTPRILKRNYPTVQNNNQIISYNKDGDKIHQCALCSYVSTNSSNLARHVESFHIPHKCRYCPSVLKGRRELSDHLKHIHKSKITLRDYFNHNEPAPIEDNSEEKIILKIPIPKGFEHFAVKPGNSDKKNLVKSAAPSRQKTKKKRRKSTTIPIPPTIIRNPTVNITLNPEPIILKPNIFPFMNIEDARDAKEAFETAFKTIVTEQPVSVLPIDHKVSLWETYAQFE